MRNVYFNTISNWETKFDIFANIIYELRYFLFVTGVQCKCSAVVWRKKVKWWNGEVVFQREESGKVVKDKW